MLVLHAGGRYGIRRRPAHGLLEGLWELPSYGGKLTPEQLRERLCADGFAVREILRLHTAKHIFTHIEWQMDGYYVELDAPAQDLVWATAQALRETYALPSAFRAFRAVIEEEQHGS